MRIEDLPIGSRIYYGGDIENENGFGTVMEHKQDNSFGDFLTVLLDDGRCLKMIPALIIKNYYAGNGSTRLVTLQAYNSYHRALHDSRGWPAWVNIQ